MLERYPSIKTWDVASEMLSDSSTDWDQVFRPKVPWTKVDDFLCKAF